MSSGIAAECPAWSIPGYLEVRNGHLVINGVDAIELVKEFKSPLFVFSEGRIRDNINRLKRAAETVDRPIKFCYASKANSNMAILKAVLDSGIDCEVNSGGELFKALRIGFKPDQIIASEVRIVGCLYLELFPEKVAVIRLAEQNLNGIDRLGGTQVCLPPFNTRPIRARCPDRAHTAVVCQGRAGAGRERVRSGRSPRASSGSIGQSSFAGNAGNADVRLVGTTFIKRAKRASALGLSLCGGMAYL